MTKPKAEDGWSGPDENDAGLRGMSVWTKDNGPNSIRVKVVQAGSSGVWWIYDATNGRSLQHEGWVNAKASSDNFKSWEQAVEFLEKFS